MVLHRCMPLKICYVTPKRLFAPWGCQLCIIADLCPPRMSSFGVHLTLFLKNFCSTSFMWLKSIDWLRSEPLDGFVLIFEPAETDKRSLIEIILALRTTSCESPCTTANLVTFCSATLTIGPVILHFPPLAHIHCFTLHSTVPSSVFRCLFFFEISVYFSRWWLWFYCWCILPTHFSIVENNVLWYWFLLSSVLYWICTHHPLTLFPSHCTFWNMQWFSLWSTFILPHLCSAVYRRCCSGHLIIQYIHFGACQNNRLIFEFLNPGFFRFKSFYRHCCHGHCSVQSMDISFGVLFYLWRANFSS